MSPCPHDLVIGQIEDEGVQAPELVDDYGFHPPVRVRKQAANLGGAGRPGRHLI